MVTGPKIAIDAIHQGQEAAESIKRFLEGKDIKQGRQAKEDKLVEDVPEFIEKKARVLIPEVPVTERKGFDEVYLSLSAEDAMEEAKRCLNCRRCLGCRICEEFCKPEAIDYLVEPTEERINVGSIIIATGFDEYDAHAKKELGYGMYPQCGHEHRIRAHPFRHRAHGQRHHASLRRKDTAEDRLYPVRGQPRQGERILFLGLLHVRHKRSSHRQGTSERYRGRHLLYGHQGLWKGI